MESIRLFETKGDPMFRTLLLTVICLILASANSAVAQKPFKNKTALAAKKAFEEAIAKAKKEYAEKLDIAIKEAGGAGDVDDVNLLAAEKKRVDGSDAFTAFHLRLIGTKWNSSRKNPKQWCRFEKNNVGTCHDGGRFRWYPTVANTVVTQNNNNNKMVHVWHFDSNIKSATVHEFKRGGTIAGGSRRVR